MSFWQIIPITRWTHEASLLALNIHLILPHHDYPHTKQPLDCDLAPGTFRERMNWSYRWGISRFCDDDFSGQLNKWLLIVIWLPIEAFLVLIIWTLSTSDPSDDYSSCKMKNPSLQGLLFSLRVSISQALIRVSISIFKQNPGPTCGDLAHEC